MLNLVVKHGRLLPLHQELAHLTMLRVLRVDPRPRRAFASHAHPHVLVVDAHHAVIRPHQHLSAVTIRPFLPAHYPPLRFKIKRLRTSLSLQPLGMRMHHGLQIFRPRKADGIKALVARRRRLLALRIRRSACRRGLPRRYQSCRKTRLRP